MATSAAATPATALPPLQAAWLERLGAGEQEIVVTPPVGVTEARPLVVGAISLCLFLYTLAEHLLPLRGEEH